MTQEAHVASFRSLATDASCLIHRGGRASASDHLHGRPSTKWMGYPLRIIAAIVSAGCRPVVVFDGAPLPIKVRCDQQRRLQRQLAGRSQRRR